MSAVLDDVIAPADEAGICEAVRQARDAGRPLAIEGQGSKRGMLRPVQASATLSTRALTGITLYRPQEMVLAARAGTTIAEIEAVLDAERQMLIAEPPDFSALFGHDRPSTIGGMVATNLSGPRRIGAGGSLRDQLLGVRVLTGHAEAVRSGGRVHKNVTGLDLCKLLAGSHGTLGVLTEVTLKLLPRPETSITLSVAVPDFATGVAALSAGLGSPFGLSGAALLARGPTALLRLEDFSRFVGHRGGALKTLLSRFGEVSILEEAESVPLWREVRDAVALGAAPEEAVWRLSVKPSEGPKVAAALQQAFGAKLLLDWGGGLVWVAGPATEAAHQAVMAAAEAARGSFCLFRAPEALRGSQRVMPDEAPGLAAIAARVKAALDPAGVLNPGRMRAGA